MSQYALVLHGGAVTMEPGKLPPEEEAQQRQGLQEALQAGWQILHDGGTALDAVEAAVRLLENNEHFNAGRGSGLTRQGEVEMDAAIMDGRTLQAGAVSGVKYVQNPISLAWQVIDNSPHVCLSGEGALELALECGLPLQPPSYFQTEKTRQEWLELLQQNPAAPASHDTVGAVALDQAGNLAVATSTGGLEGQSKGRVGDSPVLGGGTYASNESCAVSCTGEGEVILRGALAHEVYALVKYRRLPLNEACQAAVHLRDE
ncbi:isoaspartyl peptidase/L-asparaginase family protein [Hymenobacter endophyticus]|uniref:Isoaspartyl peptidase/L-asparaginase n=1 Tax=Hymenobacter endophyticus TaxID=3076335 RepID=A0ABU3TDI7_9BACT|nr:isoaspartyl peptidase/L-asparaginase [Hymenobacter endophyticus]MDU0369433.1 isoaspartyl peptidase/L-asparaginase [Hymenobacter endophyticus]